MELKYFCTVECCIVENSAAQYSTEHCCTLQYRIVLYSTVQNSAVQYSAVQPSAAPLCSPKATGSADPSCLHNQHNQMDWKFQLLTNRETLSSTYRKEKRSFGEIRETAQPLDVRENCTDKRKLSFLKKILWLYFLLVFSLWSSLQWTSLWWSYLSCVSLSLSSSLNLRITVFNQKSPFLYSLISIIQIHPSPKQTLMYNKKN